MKRTSSAALALAIVPVVILLFGFTGMRPPQAGPLPPPVITQSDATPTTLAEEPAAPAIAPTSAPTATMARRQFLDTTAPKIAPTTFLPGQGPDLAGEMVYSGRRLDFFVGRNTFSPEQVAELGVKSEVALNYLQKRFAQKLVRRVSIGVYSKGMAPTRDTRGLAHSSDNFLQIFYQPGEDTRRALVIITHELGHQLQADAYGDEAQRRADLVLHEGLATWISGEYWLTMCGAESFQARARELAQAGYSTNLASVHGSAPSDVTYEMWAGFVEWLTRTYGWDKFNALYISGSGRSPGSADYGGIYGKSFGELNAEWRESLK